MLGIVAPHSGGAPVATQTPGSTGPARTSPYNGTPAEYFAVGAAGIVLPPAKPVPDGYLVDYTLATGDISAEKVADALADVRGALVAGRLERRVLVHHDLDPFIRTLARAYWDTWFDPHIPGAAGHELVGEPAFAGLVTLLAPDVELVAEPRVAGRITYGPVTTYRGAPATGAMPYRVLEIVTRFAWVYAFDVPEDGTEVAIVVVQSEVSWHVPADYRLGCCEVNLGLHPVKARASVWGADCEAYAEGLIRPGEGARTAGITEAAFDVDRPLEPAASCERDT